MGYGMNDGGFNAIDATIENTYRKGLERIVANFQHSGTRTIIIGSPGVVDPFYLKNSKHPDISADEYNRTLGRLGTIGKEVATSKGVLFADLRTPLGDAMKKAKAQFGEHYPIAGGDGIHGGPNEHLVMAYAFLKAMGFDGNIGTITYDSSSGKARATEGHRVVSSKTGNVVIESSRYPFCFFNGNNDVNKESAIVMANWNYGNAAILPFVPQ